MIISTVNRVRCMIASPVSSFKFLSEIVILLAQESERNSEVVQCSLEYTKADEVEVDEGPFWLSTKCSM